MKTFFRQAFHLTGGMRVVRWLHGSQATILLYHKFPENRDGLSKELAYLTRYYNVVSIDEISDALSTGRPLRERSVAVTVDDGHRGFFRNAFPVFKSFGVPVTLYACSEILETQSWFWFDRIEYAFLRSPVFSGAVCFSSEPASHLNVSEHADPIHVDSNQQRLDRANDAAEIAKRLAEPARLNFVRSLENVLEVEIPKNPPEEYAPLTWDEVRLMAPHRVTIGAHTATHPILSRLTDDSQLINEIEGSKRKIEQEIGAPVEHFSYPNGQPHDISPRIVEVVRKAGFKTAVTTLKRQVSTADDPLLLPRICCEASFPEYRFRQTVAAFRV